MTEETKTSLVEEQEGLLVEYNSLRDEIMGMQRQRLQIISFTVGAVGAMLSIAGNTVLGSETIDPWRRLLVAAGGAIAAYAIVIPSLIMTISLQQGIRRLGGYIRTFIEPFVPGLRWQFHWQRFKAWRGFKSGLGNMGGIYHFLSVLPLLLPLYAAVQYPEGWMVTLVLIPFLVWSICLSIDLRTGRSRDWKWATWAGYPRTTGGGSGPGLGSPT